MTPPFLRLHALVIATVIAAHDEVTRSSKDDQYHSPRKKNNNVKQRHKEKQEVKTTLCSTQDCNDYNGEAERVGVCKTYLTPLSKCYNAKNLFPGDESWSDIDILDELSLSADVSSLKRTFYKSKDGSCSDVDYSWIQPFEVCEGPFGKPRPWGKFSLVDIHDIRVYSEQEKEEVVMAEERI